MRSLQHAICSGQHATRSGQHAADNMQRTTCNMQRTTCSGQHATCSGQHATCSGQHAADSMQHDMQPARERGRHTGHVHVVSHLLHAGADSTAVAKSGANALHMARVPFHGSNGLRALPLAAWCVLHVAACRLLHLASACCMWQAATMGHAGVVGALLSAGALVDALHSFAGTKAAHALCATRMRTQAHAHARRHMHARTHTHAHTHTRKHTQNWGSNFRNLSSIRNRAAVEFHCTRRLCFAPQTD
jgi:hypothetical protein